METKPLQELQFTNTLKKYRFNVRYEFSFIRLKKIILKSHLNPNNRDWVSILSDTNLIIRSIRIEEGKEIQSERYLFNLMQFLTPNHQFPMLDISIELPSKTQRDYFNSSNFHNVLEIEIILLNEKISDFEYIIYFEDTPGILKEN